MSALSLIPEEKRKHHITYSSKSMESLYSSSSSKLSIPTLHRRKPHSRPTMVPATNEVRQRVVSARLLRMKHLQNQVADAQQHITELTNENRLLRTLHKRQDSALAKYESSNAELPQLLNSHAEEIRMWQIKYKNLQNQNRDLANKLKQKDAAYLALSDQNKHLVQLNKDRNLEEREKLSDRVHLLEERLIEKEEEIRMLVRRLQLETKTFKTQLANEHQKYRELCGKLDKANEEINRLNNCVGPSMLNSNITKSNTSLAPKSSVNNKFDKDNNNKVRRIKSKSQTRQSKENENESHLSKNDITNMPDLKQESDHDSAGECEIINRKLIEERRPSQTSRSYLGSHTTINKDDKLEVTSAKSQKKSELAFFIRNGMSGANDECHDTGRHIVHNDDDKNNASDFDDDQNENRDEEDDDDDDVIITTGFSKKVSYRSHDTSRSDYKKSLSVRTIESEFQELKITSEKRESIEESRKSDRGVEIGEPLKKDNIFFDTFCDSATTSSRRDYTSGRLSSGNERLRSNIDPKKKVKLLAALKAIEDNEAITN